MRSKPGHYVDGRPRLHIWPDAKGAAWSVGPLGMRIHHATAGQALDDALRHIGPQPAVVIVEPHG